MTLPFDLSLDSIRRDGDTQPRATLNAAQVSEYHRALLDGDKLPPVTVFFDGEIYWLADGFHRFEAAKAAGHETISADVVAGNLSAARWFSFGSNKTHGLQRSTADKERAIKAALRHPACTGLSDREIGRHVGCDHKTVAGWRAKMTGEIPQSPYRTGADGRTINITGLQRVALPHPDELRQAGADTPEAEEAKANREAAWRAAERVPPLSASEKDSRRSRKQNDLDECAKSLEEAVAKLRAGEHLALMQATLRFIREGLHERETKHVIQGVCEVIPNRPM